jgi:hypothetical protein
MCLDKKHEANGGATEILEIDKPASRLNLLY